MTPAIGSKQSAYTPSIEPSFSKGASVDGLAGDPLAMLQALEARAGTINRTAAVARRELEHSSRLAHLQAALDKMEDSALNSLISGLVQAALNIGAAAVSGASAVQDLKAGDAARVASRDALSNGASAEAAQKAAKEASAKVTSSMDYLRLKVASALLPLKEALAKAEPCQYLAQKNQTEKAREDLKAETVRKFEDEAQQAAQAFRQSIDQAQGRMQKMVELQHEARMISIGRA